MDKLNDVPKIICEIASSHEGSFSACLQLIRSISSIGVEFVKFQIFDTSELVADSVVNSPLNSIYIKPSDWDLLIHEASKCNLKVICEFYDEKSVGLINNHSLIYAYKIPTSDINDFSLIHKIYSYNKPVFIGVGGAVIDEIYILAEHLKQYKNKTILLHGFQNFPTQIDDVNISKIKWLSDTFKFDVGYADHTDSNNKLRDIPCFLALAFGASYIEKHISPDRFLKKSDYHSALNIDEFKIFISDIKNVAEMMKMSEFNLLDPAESNYRENMKKFAIAKEHIEKNQPFSLDKIVFKRTSSPGLARIDFSNKNYKVFLTTLNAGQMISNEDLG
ncbi:hypothetical protein FIT70_04240 [Candidatus Methylopumilus universalis]|uniref:N-acetylneuraminate synthase family protein n=1 Tax=Candidatus Methylopumilus universalis TaxID=2588536 RepID=UPI001120A200|nr:N-acetylneuraminate synthase family protein [Candidatus Methylopumilus universalis]QDC99122.1 hypothetical protein FIT70_04240 [Candidatus Methylopumilus universalis]